MNFKVLNQVKKYNKRAKNVIILRNLKIFRIIPGRNTKVMFDYM